MRSIKSLSWIERLAGTASRPVPPHVFRLDESRLRYARLTAGPAADTALEVADLQEVVLGPETIAEGTLGGTVREAGHLRQSLEELLAKISVPVSEASLVLPDSWIRLVFAEGDTLPRSASARAEILRFKLKRLIPFRVEDLRLSDCPAPGLVGQEEPQRYLLAFGMEALLQQLESIFAGAGVRLGQISNETLALLAAVEGAAEPLDLAALVYARANEYSLTFLAGGQPVIHRFKVTPHETPPEVRASQIGRDLRLTRKFVRDRLETTRLRRIFLAASTQAEPRWREILQQVFEVPVTGLAELPRFAAAGRHDEPEALGPLMGAACRAA